ncbi:rhodanese-like domain-containing protein [Aeoliella sp.]|uniref:rhodanese-like domain-containing protein n=1 Tax=Aeoliella sp. TaxID=2795800 RepID=UPI003CCB8D80
MNLEISVADTKRMLDAGELPLLVDCREQHEWDLVRIDGATLLPMSELTTRVGELTGREQQHMVVYCHHGGRSAQVANWLRGQGFTSTQSMAGGIDQWAVEIDPELARY